MGHGNFYIRANLINVAFWNSRCIKKINKQWCNLHNLTSPPNIHFLSIHPSPPMLTYSSAIFRTNFIWSHASGILTEPSSWTTFLWGRACYGTEGGVFEGRESNKPSRKHSENDSSEQRSRAAALRWLRLLSLAGMCETAWCLPPALTHDRMQCQVFICLHCGDRLALVGKMRLYQYFEVCEL